MKKLSILLALLATPAMAATGPFFSLQNTNFVVLIAFIIFVGFLVYLKVPAKLTGMLDARAATIKAQQLLDAGSDKADLMVSVAKAKAGKAASLAVKEGVQMHGGIGMTDEYDIGLYMKRDRALAEFMGDLYYHADRVAKMSGY